ncbi:hypothetical protein TOPH_05621 [Tolypocladium ophioglossoides CBS 100239]|uniref:Uncharacterized protein n=1 Tax=Tolypocladium ophioglossoides (strain CBS 100239) TaxID=1163406 RepID=A0A0L0N663_TOLOC|nr:hypothetical protein TOPH_05621 [Tolypocladium ophioglossoides CBS 100239]
MPPLTSRLACVLYGHLSLVPVQHRGRQPCPCLPLPCPSGGLDDPVGRCHPPVLCSALLTGKKTAPTLLQVGPPLGWLSSRRSHHSASGHSTVRRRGQARRWGSVVTSSAVSCSDPSIQV